MYLDQDTAGNLLLLPGQAETFEEAICLADGERRNLADILPVDAHRPRFGTQTRSFALRTQSVAAILAQHHAHVQFVFFALQVSEESMHAQKGSVPVQHECLLRAAHLSPRRVERNPMLPLRLSRSSALVGPILGASPGIDRAFIQRLLLVGNDQVEIEVDGVAEALASLAGAVRVVEREQPGLRFAVDAVAEFAFECLGETQPSGFRFFIAGNGFEYDFARLAEADLGRVHDPCPVLRRDNQAIDQGVERLPKVNIEQRLGGGEFDNLAILVEPIEATCAQFAEPLLECLAGQGGIHGFCRSFFPPLGLCIRFRCHLRLHRKQRIEPRVFSQSQDGSGNLIHRVSPDHSAADDAMGGAAAREQQTEVIVDLGCRGHGGPRVAGRVLLLDGDGRRQTVDQVHVRLLDAFQELPGIGRKRFDVTALPFRIDGVESKRGFART